jgi:hypothetical protein
MKEKWPPGPKWRKQNLRRTWTWMHVTLLAPAIRRGAFECSLQFVMSNITFYWYVCTKLDSKSHNFGIIWHFICLFIESAKLMCRTVSGLLRISETTKKFSKKGHLIPSILKWKERGDKFSAQFDTYIWHVTHFAPAIRRGGFGTFESNW